MCAFWTSCSHVCNPNISWKVLKNSILLCVRTLFTLPAPGSSVSLPCPFHLTKTAVSIPTERRWSCLYFVPLTLKLPLCVLVDGRTHSGIYFGHHDTICQDDLNRVPKKYQVYQTESHQISTRCRRIIAPLLKRPSASHILIPFWNACSATNKSG